MAVGQGVAARVRKAWGWIMAGGESPAQAEANNGGSETYKDVQPLSCRLVVIAILCVSALFIVVMLFYGWRGVIKDDAQVVAALTSAFGIIGTLVGAYFGFKSSNDARDTVENVHSKTTGAVQQAASAAQHAAAPPNNRRKKQQMPLAPRSKYPKRWKEWRITPPLQQSPPGERLMSRSNYRIQHSS
jgi:hypothetical protein